MRWRYFEARTQVYWASEPRGFRIAATDRTVVAATVAGARLRSLIPTLGWVATLPRDGKTYVCNPETRGRRPAWIWTGDIP